jgi:hypothetical protein
MAPIVLSDTTLAERLLLTGEANMANEDQELIDSNLSPKAVSVSTRGLVRVTAWWVSLRLLVSSIWLLSLA